MARDYIESSDELEVPRAVAVRRDPVPETVVDLQYNLYTPDRTRSTKFHKSMFKELNISNFDRLDQDYMKRLHSLEMSAIEWGLDRPDCDFAGLLNAQAQYHASTCRSLGEIGGFGVKNLNTQRQVQELSTYQQPVSRDLLSRLRPQQDEPTV